MPIEIDGVRFWLRAGAPIEATRALLQRGLAEIAAGRVPNQKTGRRKALFELSGVGVAALLWKRNDYDVAASLRRALRPSKSRHELQLGTALAARGVASVVPLAAGEERRGGRLLRCHLVVERVEGASDLARLWIDREVTVATRRALAAELGRLVRAACEAGLLQDDFAPNNVLVARDAPRLRLVDFERARLARRAASARWQAWMIAKLERALPALRDVDRLRFLVGFANGDRERARAIWRTLAPAIEGLARRDAQRLARHAARDGRRLRTIARDGLRGVARRELDDATLARLARQAPGLGADGFVVALRDGSLRALRAQFGLSSALARRGHMLPPLAALAGAAGSRLVISPVSSTGERVILGGAIDPSALHVLARRLAGLGLDVSLADPACFVCVDGLRGTPRALLLDPRALAGG